MKDYYTIETQITACSTEWEVIPKCNIQLSKEELKRGQRLKIDLEKFQLVKGYLLQGYSLKSINYICGVARSTTRKYKKILDKKTKEELKLRKKREGKRGGKLHEKRGKTPEIYKSGVSILLFSKVLGSQTPPLQILPLSLLPLLLFWGYWVWSKKAAAKAENKEKLKEEISFLFGQYLKVLDLKFNGTPFICANSVEQAYYKKMCRIYNNKNRPVELLERLPGETNSNYFFRKDRQKKYWLDTNKEKSAAITSLKKETVKEWKNAGLLCFFELRHGVGSLPPEAYQKSKVFLYTLCDELIKNPLPTYRQGRKGISRK